MNIKHCLFDYDNVLCGGETLVVCEGPFDAIRVNWFGERWGIRATCLFGKSISPEQEALLFGLSSLYRDKIAFFDFDAFEKLLLPDYLGIKLKYLPAGINDPAEFDEHSFNKVLGF